MTEGESGKSDQDYTNQKQLRAGESQEDILHLSGDESTDDRADISSESKLTAVTLAKKMGGPFMHPMHDASADQQFASPLAPQPDRASHVNPPNRPARPPRAPRRQYY